MTDEKDIANYRYFHQTRGGVATAIVALMLFQLSSIAPAIAQSEPSNFEPKELSRPQLFALACPALLSYYNAERHDWLWCTDPTPENINRVKRLLAEDWGDRNHDELLRSITWLENGGQRVDFERYAAMPSTTMSRRINSKLTIKVHLGEDAKRRHQIAQQYKNVFGKKSLIAWDYCRVISLCRWGVLAGYLSESEAWSHIMPAARKLQSTFSSWQDMGTNYVVGRRFWSATAPSYKVTFEKLLTETGSPWRTIPWTTSLAKDHKATLGF